MTRHRLATFRLTLGQMPIASSLFFLQIAIVMCVNASCFKRSLDLIDLSKLQQFLPARRSKRGICYGNVAGWLGV